MRNPVRRASARRVRREMDRLAGEIIRSQQIDPDGFVEREHLWTRREELRDRYARLTGGTA